MRRPCEICTRLKATSEVESDRYVLIERRVVALCGRHGDEVKQAGIDTLDSLNDHFKEVTGARSLLPRRGAANRRMFPPRPEGRRCSDGRRWDDTLID